MAKVIELEALKDLQAMLVARGVTGLSVFGSQIRGEAKDESDLDLIIDYDPESRFSLLDLVAVGRIIEEHMGVKADVMTRQGLHPLLKDNIEAEAIRVF